jgi:3-oxoacyl-[acyl-carrier protein] reductase
MNDLFDRVALVTGGSRGIGRDTALALAHAGCHVAVNFQKEIAEAESIVEEIKALGRRAFAFQNDIGKENEAKALVVSVLKAFGTVDVVVNNAGINRSKPLDKLRAGEWDETIQVNLSSAFYVTQAVLPTLRAQRWGRIIMISSIAAQTGGVIGPHYAASKAGLIGLAHSYAHLLAREGITANAVAPALIDTDMIRGNDAITPNLIPIGRFGQASEVSSVVVMLASNGYINGQTINVNGGWYMS